MKNLSSCFILLLVLATLCAGFPIDKRQRGENGNGNDFYHSGHGDSVDSYDSDYHSKSYLRITTPNSGTVWQADSYQSVTWSYDGSSNLGYSETVVVVLLARQTSGEWKKVDTLPSGTTGSGISNYHVRKDLGKASAYMVVLEIDKVHYRVRSEPFKIKPLSGHYNDDENSWYSKGDEHKKHGGDPSSWGGSNNDPDNYDPSYQSPGYTNPSTYHPSSDPDYTDHSDDDSWSKHYGKKNYLRLITPTSKTVWDADSYQSVTWAYDGSSNLGYGETVIVILYAVDSPGGNWYKVDTLPSGTTGGGISNYHVRKDLGKAYSYMIVLEIDKVHFTIGSDPFKIKKSINHYNEDSDSWTEWSGDSDSSDFSSYDPSSYDSNGSNSGDYNTNTYDSSTSTYSYSSHGNDDSVSNPDDSKRYLRVTSPKLYTVWDADSYQTVTWTYDGSSNLGYGETVTVSLYARQSPGDWKLVDTLPSGTIGGGVSNYHVRKDLGEADYYMVVLGIEKINYEVAGSPFEIKKVSSHSNYDGDKYSGKDDKDYSKKKNDYLRIVTPNSGTVWDTGSYQSVTWATSGSANVNYGEPVHVYLYSYDTSSKSVKKVDTLQSGTVGSGISNYHVRDDLGRADYYVIVLEIDSYNYRIHGQPFKIKRS